MLAHQPPVYRAVQPIWETFAESVRADPGRPAVDDGAMRLSRFELHAAALRLAEQIAELVPAGAPVGLFLANDALFPVAALACAAAGCPHVALDTRYPPARNAEIAARAGLVATVDSPASACPDFDAAAPLVRLTINPDSLAAPVSAWSELAVPPRALGIDAPFVVLFTSGSTGVPKGVAHSQRSILHSVHPDVDALALSSRDRALGLYSPSTISGVRAFLSALHAGAFWVVRDPRSGLESLLEAMHREQITIVRAVPTLMRAIVRVDRARDALAALRVVQLGGERVYGTDIALLRTVIPASCRISIGFGSTEAGVVAQWFVDEDVRGVVACGYACAGTTLDVVTADGVPVPNGEVGELRSSGPATALGFWDGTRPVLDGISAVPNDPTARTLRTGDLFRRRADGLLESAGRVDRMIKLRGRRVDLGDVEAAVRACSGVIDAAVVAANVHGATRVTAFIVGVRGVPRLSDAVRRDLRARLPEHMLPAEVRAIEAIPHLPGFKPDIAALERLALEPVRPARRRRAAVPRGRTALAVAAVWTELLGAQAYRDDKPWNAAGGDSLGMLQLAYGLERRLGLRVALELLQPHMRPSELAAGLERIDLPTAGANARAIVFCPGLFGDEPRLVALRQSIGEDLRFFVPEYAPWSALVGREASVGTVVDGVVEQLRLNGVDQHPLIVVGYSFGGLVAHELARRFVAAGKDVARVVILDTDPASIAVEPWRDDVALDAPPHVPGRVRRLVVDVRTKGVPSTVADRIGLRIATIVERRPWLRTAIARRGHVPLPPQCAFAFRFYMTWFVRGALARSWSPAVLDRPVTLFRAVSRSHAAAPDLGWQRHAASVAVEHVEGSHYSMVAGSDGEQLAVKLRQTILAQL